MQKTLAFPYPNSKVMSEKEIQKTTAFTKKSKIIRYLEINLTKDIKNLYTDKQRHRHREQRYGYQGGEEGWDRLGNWD